MPFEYIAHLLCTKFKISKNINKLKMITNSQVKAKAKKLK